MPSEPATSEQTEMDEGIIRRCLSGETEAFEAIVEKYQSSLLALAIQLLRDREEARDAVQDSLVQVYMHLNRFIMGRNFRTWIHSITYKRCLDRIRKRKTFQKYLSSPRINTEDLFTHSTEGCGPGLEIWSSRLQKLNTKERLSLYLTISEGYSVKEIAEIISCTESTVRVHVHRAKNKLRSSMRGEKLCANSLSF